MARASGKLGRRFARMADSVGNSNPALRMAQLLTLETLQDPPEQLLTKERREYLAEMTDPFLAYRYAADRFQQHDPVQQMLLTDITIQLPSQFLTKVDRATMAAGIEARVPLLDERVGELAVSMPSIWKTAGTEKKIVLRESQRGRLPNSILDGPKMGFGVPYEFWLRTSLYGFTIERLLDPNFAKTFGFQTNLIERTLQEHKSRQKDKGFLLWKLLQLSLWKEANDINL